MMQLPKLHDFLACECRTWAQADQLVPCDNRICCSDPSAKGTVWCVWEAAAEPAKKGGFRPIEHHWQ